MESTRPSSDETITHDAPTQSVETAPPVSRLTYTPYFCPENVDPFTQVSWHLIDVVLKDGEGNVVFEQAGVEAPVRWSERAVRIVAQKYFRGRLGTPEREYSVKQIIKRVAGTIWEWATVQGYFETPRDAQRFHNDLVVLLLEQRGSFNSPVWFNLGVKNTLPQVSACFIQSVEDTMQSIAELQMGETLIFKRGSGTGTNFSNLRSRKEHLAGGGTASGPVSFMKGLDAWAGVIKSGGKTRRAAKMAILNIDHPDILEFIECKLKEEERAQELAKAGYSTDFDDADGAYASVCFQNANHAIRVPDEFMNAVQLAMENPSLDPLWELRARTTGEVIDRVPVRTLWNKICEASYICGDPGMQFDTTTNKWHTCPSDGRINATNPCQPDFAPVLTPEGIRTFADIKKGSTIWSGKQWTQVSKKWRTGVKPVYRYYTRAGVFIGTATHNVISHGDRIQVQEAQTIDISVLDCTIETQSLEPRDVLDGLMLGDGGVIHANDGANLYPILYVGEHDQSYFDSVVSPFINPTPYDHKRHRVEGTTLTLEELPHTYERKVPRRFLQGGRPTICGFLRGLYSANGSICGGRVTLKATSLDVIEAVQQMLSAVGIRSYYTVNKPKNVEFENGVYTCKQSYDLNITVDRCRFARMIGFIQPEKTMRLAEACTLVSRKPPKASYEVVEVEYVGDLPVWDITVEADEHTYWTGGLLVSNCSEFAFLDDTSCNLASLNLMAFAGNASTDIFNTEDFQKAVSVFIIAQDAMVSQAFYPTERIAAATKKYRALGLGFTNLGAFLMAQGLAYDSDAARSITSEITSLMTATAYLTSAKIAAVLGPFEAYERNRPAMERVIKQHRDEAYRHRLQSVDVWDRAITAGEVCGYRNAQTTLIAPTGTISFMMDCDTTGCEPEISLYKVKKLVGGGSVVLENRVVDQALKVLGYSDAEREGMLRYLGENKTLEGCSWLRSQHWPVFDCAVPSAGKRILSLLAHLDMMMAIQPFISGAISKTVNMAASATAEDIGKAFFNAWLNGIKNIIIYRNRSKLSQPIESKKATSAAATFITDPTPVRRKLRDHQNNCHRIKIEFGQMEGYLVATPYEDTGMPGEIFVVLSKEGSTISGLVDGWATGVSLCLQYGVPLEKLVDKFSHAKFEPSGFSGDPDIRHASSIYDAIIRKLAAVFITPAAVPEKIEDIKFEKPFAVVDGVMERPICTVCGSITQQNGATCYVCPVCGNGTGCS